MKYKIVSLVTAASMFVGCASLTGDSSASAVARFASEEASALYLNSLPISEKAKVASYLWAGALAVETVAGQNPAQFETALSGAFPQTAQYDTLISNISSLYASYYNSVQNKPGWVAQVTAYANAIATGVASSASIYIPTK